MTHTERLTEHLYAEPLYPESRATRDVPIDLPAGSVDANGDAIIYPELCAPIRDNETVVDHGARVLLYLMQTEGYGLVSVLELERAMLASQYAICARGISVPAANQLSNVRHRITGVLARLQGPIDTTPAIATGGRLPSWDPFGDKEPLEPLPKTDPPAGAYAAIEPRRDRIQF